MAIACAVTKRTIEQVTITLDREEAEALVVVLDNVGGHPRADPSDPKSGKSARGSIDSIIDALLRAGVPSGYELKRNNKARYATSGSVFFSPIVLWTPTRT